MMEVAQDWGGREQEGKGRVQECSQLISLVKV